MATWKKLLHESSAAADFPTLNQSTTGSAATLTTARAIALTGSVTGTANFDGSAGISIATTMANAAVDSAQLKNGSVDAVHFSSDVITGQTAETSIADDDVLLLYDNSASALRKMTKANLVSGLSADTTLSTEEVQDIVGGMVDGGTETRVAVTYDDTNGKLNFVVDDMTADNNTFRTIEVDTDGDGTNDNTLGATETLRFVKGSNITLTETSGKLTISGTGDTTYSAGTGISLSVANQFSIGQAVGTTDDVTFANIAGNRLDIDQIRLDNGAITVTNSNSHLDISGGSNAQVRVQDDLYVAGDLQVQGDTVTMNVGTIEVEDKLIKLANVASPTTTTANGAGIQVETSATEAEFPELKWDNSGKLTGWTLSDHKATSNEDVPVAVMQFGTSAPSGTPDPGQGTFFADATNNEVYIYV